MSCNTCVAAWRLRGRLSVIGRHYSHLAARICRRPAQRLPVGCLMVYKGVKGAPPEHRSSPVSKWTTTTRTPSQPRRPSSRGDGDTMTPSQIAALPLRATECRRALVASWRRDVSLCRAVASSLGRSGRMGVGYGGYVAAAGGCALDGRRLRSSSPKFSLTIGPEKPSSLRNLRQPENPSRPRQPSIGETK